jgi:hypothetical protein
MIRLHFCVACGATDDLHHHHLLPREFGGDDSDTNFITLCTECRGKIHGINWRHNHRELITAGMATAKENGTKSGKAIGRPAIDSHTRTAIVQS